MNQPIIPVEFMRSIPVKGYIFYCLLSTYLFYLVTALLPFGLKSVSCFRDVKSIEASTFLNEKLQLKILCGFYLSNLFQSLILLLFAVKGSKVSWDCHKEMAEHRRMLLEDFRLSPEIVSHCSNDILEYCNGLEAGGRTIHCLMEHSRPKRRKDRVSPPCQRAVSFIFHYYLQYMYLNDYAVSLIVYLKTKCCGLMRYI